MFKKIEIVNQEDNTLEITINSENIVFLSTVDLSSNVVGLDGEPKPKMGTAIALSSGIVLNSELTVDEIVKLFGE